MKIINCAKRYKAIGPYSQAVISGQMFITSGVIGVNEKGELANDLDGQVSEIFLNIKDILAEQKLSLSNVVKTTCFLSDMNDFATFNKLYEIEFGEHKPARSTVQVARLPRDAKIEIEFIAEIN
ncbi:MAG: Rid family detoxifying hydrolase [Patescibacteria group bacterium]